MKNNTTVQAKKETPSMIGFKILTSKNIPSIEIFENILKEIALQDFFLADVTAVDIVLSYLNPPDFIRTELIPEKRVKLAFEYFSKKALEDSVDDWFDEFISIDIEKPYILCWSYSSTLSKNMILFMSHNGKRYK